ncbi:MAG: MFS transporter [Acidobacteriota bacterium]|nr:MFS transporter [Acidobacteriota bacterium]
MAVTTTDSVLSPRTRWTIVGLLSASITINLLDRQILSVLASELRTQFKWTNAQYGYIAVAFNLGMMCGQVPAGSLLDRIGTRIGLAAMFAAWCLIGAAHALAGPGTVIDSIASAILSAIPGFPVLAGGLAGFILLRFLMGLSECGNYTAGIKALAGLFPAATRSKAGGIFNAGAQLGSVIAPPIVVFIAAHSDWRMAFLIPSLVGLMWMFPWLATFPDKQTMTAIAVKPAGTAPASAATISLGQLIRNRKVIGLCLIRIFTGPITTFYWTWLPLYLRTGRGMSFLAIGFFASVPNLIGMTGNVVGGMATDRFVKATGSVDRGRKIAFTCAFGLGALSMTMPFVSNDYLAVALMGLALFGNQWVAATYIGTVGDIVPQHLAGRVNGIAGLGDNGAALLAVLYTGIIVDKYGWTPVFFGAGLLPFLAMASVFLVLRRIEPARFE